MAKPTEADVQKAMERVRETQRRFLGIGGKKRKRTKSEAKKRIASVPDLPTIPGIVPVPPLIRPVPRLVSAGAKELAKVLVDIDPLNRTAQPTSPQPLPITRVSPESFIPVATQQEEPTMITREEIIQMLVNDPLLEITEDMLPIINDPSILMNGNGELVRNEFSNQFRRDKLEPKPKRKVSKYQKELGRQLKMLKKKHPRTKVTALMKRAHRLTRKALK